MSQEVDALLVMAAESGDLRAVRAALARGADPNARLKGMTALSSAARSGKRGAVDLLMSHGADVWVTDDDGHVPIYHAAGRGHTDVTWALLRRHAPCWGDQRSMDGVLTRDEALGIAHIWSSFFANYKKAPYDERDMPLSKEVVLAALAIEIQHAEKEARARGGDESARWSERLERLRALAVYVPSFQAIDDDDAPLVARVQNCPDITRADAQLQNAYVVLLGKYMRRAQAEIESRGEYPYCYRARDPKTSPRTASTDQWYAHINNSRVGPMTRPQLEQAIRGGQVARGTWVWHTGLPNWIAAGDAPELGGAFTTLRRSTPPPLPT